MSNLFSEKKPHNAEFCLDSDHPESLFNLVAPVAREAMADIPEELLVCPEDQLKIQKVDLHLRRNLHEEYARALIENRSVNLKNVYDGLISRTAFYGGVLQNKHRLAYIMRVPVSYENKLKEGLDLGIDRLLNEVLTMPIKNPKGYYDQDAVKNLIKAIEFCDVRVRGSVVQRVEKRSVNVNVNQNQTTSPKDVTPGGDPMLQLDMKMSEVKKKLALARGEMQIEREVHVETQADILKDSPGEGS